MQTDLELLKSAEPEFLISHFKGLSESRRTELHKLLVAANLPIPEYNLKIARIALAPLKALKKSKFEDLPSCDHISLVLQDRAPDWLADFAEYLCTLEPLTFWPLVRKLELETNASIVHNSDYWTAMAYRIAESCYILKDEELSGLLGNFRINADGLLDMLADKNTILRFCDPYNEPAAATRQSAFTRMRKLDYANWWKTNLIGVSRSLDIEKRRLAEHILKQFAETCFTLPPAPKQPKNFSARIISWYFTLHHSLELSPAEQVELTKEYTQLLNVEQTVVVLWALEQLQSVLDSTKQSPEAELLIATIGSNMAKKGRAAALAGIQLLSKLSKTTAQLEPALFNAACQLLSNESEEVQKKALSLIADLADSLDSSFVKKLKDSLPFLSILQRQRAEDLISEKEKSFLSQDNKNTQTDHSRSPAATAGPADNSTQETDWQARIKDIDPAFIQAAGVMSALNSLNHSLPIEKLRFDSMEIPHLNSHEKILPLSNIDELIFLFLEILHGKKPDLSLELALDAGSRFTTESASALKTKSADLAKLARKNLLGRSPDLCYPHHNLTFALSGLVILWLGDLDENSDCLQKMEKRKSEILKNYCSRELLFEGVVFAVAHAICNRSGRSLLSLPTHANYWIDPVIAVERIKKEKPEEIDTFDFALMLSRLAADKRQEALLLAEYEYGFHFDCLRAALGSREWQSFAGTPLETIIAMSQRLDNPSSLRIPAYLSIEEKTYSSYFDPDMTLDPEPKFPINSSLIALDAFDAAIEDGRIDKIGGTTVPALFPIASNSALHQQVIRRSLEGTLEQIKHADSVHTAKHLELLYTLSLGTSESICNDNAREILLQKSKSKGKSAELAKNLLALKDNSQKARKQAAEYALEKRIERARRWQNWKEANTCGELTQAAAILSNSKDQSNTVSVEALLAALENARNLPNYSLPVRVELYQRLAQKYLQLNLLPECLQAYLDAINLLVFFQASDSSTSKLAKISQHLGNFPAYQIGTKVLTDTLENFIQILENKSPRPILAISSLLRALCMIAQNNYLSGTELYAERLLNYAKQWESNKLNLKLMREYMSGLTPGLSEPLARLLLAQSEKLKDDETMIESRRLLSSILISNGKHREAERVRFPDSDPDNNRPPAHQIEDYEHCFNCVLSALEHQNFGDAAVYLLRSIELLDPEDAKQIQEIADAVVSCSATTCNQGFHNIAFVTSQNVLQKAQEKLGENNMIVYRCCQDLCSLDYLLNDGRASFTYAQILERIKSQCENSSAR